MRDRGRLFIFYPKTSQLPVWDTDVNHCCGKNIWHWHVSNSLLSISIIGALSVSSARLPFLESPRTMGYLSMGTQHVQEIGYGCHSDMQVVHQKVLLSIREHYTTKAQDEN